MKKSKRSEIKGGATINIPIENKEFQILFSIIIVSLVIFVIIIPRINKFNKDKQYILIQNLQNPGGIEEKILVPSYLVKYGTEVMVQGIDGNEVRTKVQDLSSHDIVLVRPSDIQEHFNQNTKF